MGNSRRGIVATPGRNDRQNHPNVAPPSLGVDLTERPHMFRIGSGIAPLRPDATPAERKAHDIVFSRETRRKHFETKAHNAPDTGRTCWVYRAYAEDGALLYVGETVNPDTRMDDHRFRSAWWPYARRIEWEEYASVRLAIMVEALAIEFETPIYNRTAWSQRVISEKRRRR